MQHEAMRQLGVSDHAEAPPADNFTEAAEKRVRIGLLMQELIASENIQLDEDRIRARVEEMFAGYEDPGTIVESYMGNPDLRQRIEPLVLEEQAIECLIDKGSESVRKVAFRDYMNG